MLVKEIKQLNMDLNEGNTWLSKDLEFAKGLEKWRPGKPLD